MIEAILISKWKSKSGLALKTDIAKSPVGRFVSILLVFPEHLFSAIACPWLLVANTLEYMYIP